MSVDGSDSGAESEYGAIRRLAGPPPHDVVLAVMAIHNCSREAALLIIENDVRDLTALYLGTDRP